MLGNLEATEEYNNAGALLGLDGENEELLGDFLSTLRKMNPLKRGRMFNRLTALPPASRGSRAEMEKHFHELPAHIREGLRKGELRLADTVIYSIKPVTSKTIKLFETQDVKEIGLRNVSNAKLPKNQALLVSGIILLAGISADQTPDMVMAAEFKGLEGVPAVANGEFDLKANKKQIVPETSNNVFKTNSYTMVPAGYYKLANPRLIHDDILIELTVSLGTMQGVDKNAQLWAGLHGTITTP
ncbi:MAG: hypothetical protein HY063_10980 [Bacteroidetes bacterium]|nr:hypothetical protein [Bacteroidota bacterium]